MRAWDYSKPCIICPAMNTMMWEHPATRNSLHMLVGWGWKVVNPMKKVLACKEEGQGALAPVSTICQTLNETATIEVPIEAEAAHPPFHIKSTALSRRKCRDARFNRLFNILKGLFFGCLGISLARGIYTIHKNFSLGPLEDFQCNYLNTIRKLIGPRNTNLASYCIHLTASICRIGSSVYMIASH